MEKYSKQREEILEVLKKSYSHPTAEEIFLEVKQNNSTSSRGTVYRNLGFLTEKGFIIKIPVKDGPDRYDYIRKEHHHIICDTCKKVFDFDFEIDFNKLEKEIKNQTNVDITNNIILVHGICHKCK